MASLQAGFGLVEITPLVGAPLSGQIHVRYASGVNDPLFARAVALSDGDTSLMLVSCDLSKIGDEDVAAIRSAVAARIGIPPESIWVFTTHTHTGPAVIASFGTPKSDEYAAALPQLIVRAADTAWHDLAPASASYVQTSVDGLAFERRYRMKDGTVCTNPGIGNPDIVEPYRAIRTPLTLLGFERDATRLPIVVASFPCHADVVGGTDVSADYPGRTFNNQTHPLIP